MMDRFNHFFHGIHGFDGLSWGLICLGLLIDLLTVLVSPETAQWMSFFGLLPLLLCLVRVFSHNHEQREKENQKFLRLMHPVFEYLDRKNQEREQAQIYRFFKCPACTQKIRVPRGKGKIEITCPKCGNKFIKKT